MKVFIAEILCGSAVFIKGMDPRKLGAAEKKTILKHIFLWNNIMLSFGGDVSDDIIEYIKSDKILSKTVALNFSEYSHDDIDFSENSRALSEMKNLLIKINSEISSERCDHRLIIKYFRVLHNLPRCFLSVRDPARISENDALSYAGEIL